MVIYLLSPYCLCVIENRIHWAVSPVVQLGRKCLSPPDWDLNSPKIFLIDLDTNRLWVILNLYSYAHESCSSIPLLFLFFCPSVVRSSPEVFVFTPGKRVRYIQIYTTSNIWQAKYCSKLWFCPNVRIMYRNNLL